MTMESTAEDDRRQRRGDEDMWYNSYEGPKPGAVGQTVTALELESSVLPSPPSDGTCALGEAREETSPLRSNDASGEMKTARLKKRGGVAIPLGALVVAPFAVILPLLLLAAVALPPSPALPSASHPEAFPSLSSFTGSRMNSRVAPTLLSIVDVDASGKDRFFMADALSNKLYVRMTKSDTEFHDDSFGDGNGERLHASRPSSTPSLSVDKTEVSFGESLTISWQLGLAASRVKSGRAAADDGGNDDILALYCPADESDPRKFRDAATLHQVRATHFRAQRFRGDGNGVGVRDGDEDAWTIPSFPVLREESCQFRMYRAEVRRTGTIPSADADGRDVEDSWSFHRIATSPFISLGNSLRTPTGVHLSLTGNPTEMVVQFTTGEAGTPVIELGRRKNENESDQNLQLKKKIPNVLETSMSWPWSSVRQERALENVNDSSKIEGTSTTYKAQDMCQEPANVEEPGKFSNPGWLHTVKLVNLVPDQEYVYKVGLAAGQGIIWGDPLSFRASPPTGAGTVPFTFLSFADQGCPDCNYGPGGQQVSDLVTDLVTNGKDDGDSAHRPIRAAHLHGDISYARGAGHVWDAYLSMIQPHASRVPLMIAVGNHEYDHTDGGAGGKDPSGVLTKSGFMPTWGNFYLDSGGECGVPTSKRFSVPSGGNGVFWYSYNHGPVHVAVLSSEHNLTAGSQQYEWIDADLAEVDRAITPWVVVETHRPLYESETYFDDLTVAIGMRYEIEDLFRARSVDLALSGHYHAYLRTCDGLYHEQCDAGGPMYITVGTAGADLDSNTVLEENEWTEVFDASHWGVGRVTIMNATAMLWEFVTVGKNVTDSVWIRRDRVSQN